MNKCTHILKNLNYLPQTNSVRQNCATSQAERQLYDDFLENLDKKKNHLLCVYRPKQSI